MKTPSRMTFLTCLLGAPVLFALFPALMTMGGEYLARFGYVGNLSLLVSLPAWFTVFAWLAWRAAKRGETEMRPFVMAGLIANAASLAIYPALILVAEGFGADLSGQLAESFQEAKAAGEAEDTAFSLPVAALFTGFAAFFVGLFVQPVLGSIFGALWRRLGTAKPA